MNSPAQVTLSELANKPREQAITNVNPGFGSLQAYELALRQAKLLSASTLVPAQYQQVVEKKGSFTDNQNAIPNCVIAMNMAQRMGADPLMVMQNLYIVEGRPSWSSQWIIAAINGCGRFSPLRFDIKDHGEQEFEYSVTEWVDRQRTSRKVRATVRNLECIAWAIEKDTGERITSPSVSVEMAVKEGWYGKNGSKWQTMPEVMLRYRTASFFGKIYAPELLMGIQSVEEIRDVIEAIPDGNGGFAVDVETLKSGNAASHPSDAEGVIDKPATTEVNSAENEPDESDLVSQIKRLIQSSMTIDEMDIHADRIRKVSSKKQAEMLNRLYRVRREEISQPSINLE